MRSGGGGGGAAVTRLVRESISALINFLGTGKVRKPSERASHHQVHTAVILVGPRRLL